MENQHASLERIARRRAAAKLGFLIHLTVFIAVNAMLYWINQRATPGFSWFTFPLGGWAIGLVIHGVAVWAGGSLRERMVAAELARLQRERVPGAVGRRGQNEG